MCLRIDYRASCNIYNFFTFVMSFSYYVRPQTAATVCLQLLLFCQRALQLKIAAFANLC